MKSYSLGFVFSLDGQSVALVQKNRPPMLAGLFNGIGGQVEDGETPVECCAREVQEEANLSVDANDWSPMGVISDGETFAVHVFSAHSDLSQAKTMTDEPISVFPVSDALNLPLAPSVFEILEKWSAPQVRSQFRV